MIFQFWIAPFVSSHVGDDACRHWIDAQYYQRQPHCSFSLFFWHRPQLKDRPRRQQPNCNILVFRPGVQLLTPRIHQVGSYDRIAKGRISTRMICQALQRLPGYGVFGMSNLLPDIALTFTIGRCSATFCGFRADIWNWSNQRQGGPWWLRPGISPEQVGTSRVKQAEMTVASGCIILQFQMTQKFFEIATMNVHDDYLLGTASSWQLWEETSSLEKHMPIPSMMRTDFVSWLLLLCIARFAMWILFCHPTPVQRFIDFIVPFKYQMNQTTPWPSSLNPGIAGSLQRKLTWNYPSMFRSLNSTPVAPCGFPSWYSMQVNKVLATQCKFVVNPLGGKNHLNLISHPSYKRFL